MGRKINYKMNESTTPAPPATEAVAAAYRPFSNGSEYESWNEHNCNMCKHAGSDPDEMPICCGEYALNVALIDDGTVPVLALDFIGTMNRHVQHNGAAFCTLNPICNRFAINIDMDETGMPDGVTVSLEPDSMDVLLAEAVKAGYQKHGYGLIEKIAGLC